jgi:hypothetical protein
LDIGFIQANIHPILTSTPVEYLKTADLRGILFEEVPKDPGTICSLFTSFYVDHTEPLEALAEFDEWPLGELPEGHEFLVLVEAPPAF